MDRDEIIHWIAMMENRLGLHIWTSENGVSRELNRRERAALFGYSDLVARLEIEFMMRRGRIIVTEVCEPGMIVDDASPWEDLQEWARRLERRLGLDEVVDLFSDQFSRKIDDAEKRAKLGCGDRIAVLQMMMFDVTEA